MRRKKTQKEAALITIYQSLSINVERQLVRHLTADCYPFSQNILEKKKTEVSEK